MRDPGSLVGYMMIPVALGVLASLPVAMSQDGGSPASARATVVAEPSLELTSESPRAFEVGRSLVSSVRGRPWLPGAAADSVRALIVLLPDPDESSLDWMYDSHLSALRRALERANYVTDRMWMPSRDRRVRVEGVGHIPDIAEPDAFPGVFVFRGGGGRSTEDLVVVYVVGEVPTAGVHKLALGTALREASLFEPGAPLRILGPTFSGSAASLSAVLRAWREAEGRCRGVRIVTGSATAPGLDELLADTPVGCRRSPDLAPAIQTYHATVHTDATYARVFRTVVLDSLNLAPEEVALLTESNTGYGQNQASDDGPLGGALIVPFPLNIAAVRSEYDRNPQEPRPEEGLRRRSRIPLSLQLRSRPREAPPARSALTAPTLDMVIREILGTLHSHRIRAVGILASDVRDKLFLADLIRTELRDVLLFTFEGNSLYLRSDLGPSLRGMVVVSTYPLIMENAAWTGTPGVVPFTNETDAGVFNAVLHLLDRPFLTQEYRPPLTDRIDARPPVWLTIVGTGSLLPLAAVDPGDDAHVLTAVSRHRGGETSDHRAGVLDAVAVLMGIVLMAAGALLAGFMVQQGARAHRSQRERRPAPMAVAVAAPSFVATPAGRPSHLHEAGEGGTAVIAPPAPPVQGEEGWADGSGDEPERPPRAKKKRRGQRSLLRRDVLPEGVPWHSDELESWTAVDALAVITALLAFFAPLALLDGLRPAWEGTPDVTAGIIRVTGALLIVELGVVWTLLLRELVMTWRRQRRTRRRHIPALLHDLTAHGLAAGLGGIALLYCAQLGSLATSDPLAFGLYRFRALRLEGGVSPLLMLLLACGAVVVTVVWHLDRRKLLGDPERGPFEAAAALLRAGVGASPRDLGPWAHAFRSAARGVVRVRQNLNVRLRVSTRSAAGFALALVLAAGVAYLFGNLSFRTVEDIVLPGVITLGPQWAEGGVGGLLAGWLPGTVPAGPAMPTVLLWLGLVAGFVSIIACVSHLLAAWRPFRDTLGCLAETPLAPAFDRLPARMRTMGRLHLFDPPAPQLGRGLAEAGHEALWAEARERARRGEQGFVDLLARLPGGAPPVEGRDAPPRRRLALLHLARALRAGWERRPDLVWSAGSSADRTSQDPRAADADDPAFGAWLQHAEDVAAVEATCHVEWVLRNLRRQALLLLFVILFTTAYLEAFPFPYHSMLTTLFVILVVVGVGAVVMLMGQLSRDDVLSRINGTDPGRISWDRGSLVGAALFVALPVLALLGTEVTPVGQMLFGWVEDLLRILSNV